MRRYGVVLLSLLIGETVLLAEPQSFTVGLWGNVAIDLPAGWTATPQSPEAPGGVAIKVRPPSEVPLELLITPFPFPGTNEVMPGAARRLAESSAADAKKLAAETDIPILELSGPGCRGFYFAATDRTVDPATSTEFKYMNQGTVAVGRLMMTFTILTNLKDSPERTKALDVVRSARYQPAGPPWRTSTGTYALAFPDRKWRLAIDLPGFDIGPASILPDAQGVTLGGPNESTDMMATVFLETARKDRTEVACREDYWKKLQTNLPQVRQDVRRYQRGDMAILEFVVPEVEGVPIKQKSLNAFLVKDGAWIDVHLSKVNFQPEDQALFERILDSVRFER